MSSTKGLLPVIPLPFSEADALRLRDNRMRLETYVV